MCNCDEGIYRFGLLDIKNIEYYTGKVEDKVNVISTASNEEVVAVLDPPR